MDATDLCFAGADRQARMIAAGEVTSRQLVEATFERIKLLQPRLNAFRVTFEERALLEADQADARRKGRRSKKDEGARPLLGVPVAVKDDADIAGEVTALGTAAHGGPRERDGEMVARLRSAGAIIVGKTNVPEMVQWPFTETMTFGVTRNPWNLDHATGGSSGGTGAAVAAGLCGVAQGSDGAGSIRIPASWCGVYGHKPTRDLVPLDPYDGAWQGMSVYGPLARHVADAARFLDATAPGQDFLGALEAPPATLRIAVTLKPPPGVVTKISGEVRTAVHDTAQLLRSLGHEVVERDLPLPQWSFLTILVRYLTGIAEDVDALPHPERLERRTQTMARLGRSLRGTLRWAREREAPLAASVDQVLQDCDVVLAPGPVAPPFRIGQLHGRGALWTLNASAARVPFQGLWNAIGYPASAVPAGTDANGLPIGVQLGGRPGEDAKLLALSAQIEAARPWADRRPAL